MYYFGVFIFIHICIYLHTHTYLHIHIYISFPVCPLRENSNLPILWRLHAMHVSKTVIDPVHCVPPMAGAKWEEALCFLQDYF